MAEKTQYSSGLRAGTLARFTAPGTDTLPLSSNGPVTLAFHVAGGSIAVRLTASSRERIAAGTALWFTAEGLGAGGVVSVNRMADFDFPLTAIELTATAAGAQVEVLQ